jgi:hypothetical protein
MLLRQGAIRLKSISMEILQTYETTLYDSTGNLGFTVLSIPLRSYIKKGHGELDLDTVADDVFGSTIAELGPAGIDPQTIAELFQSDSKAQKASPRDRSTFCSYLANADIIPFEQSPLSATSLANIALKSAKAGSIGLGTTVGFLAAGGSSPMLLITVPFGIVLCGAAMSFTKWLEENRKTIWSRLAGFNIGPNLLPASTPTIKAPLKKKGAKQPVQQRSRRLT